MIDDPTFSTRHADCAAFLRYVLGDNAHLATLIRNGAEFVFVDDPIGRCRKLSDEFFAPGSVQVGDAAALLTCSRAIKQTAAAARASALQRWEGE